MQAWVKVSNTAPEIGRMEITDYGGDSIYVDMPYTGSGWELVEWRSMSQRVIWTLASIAPAPVGQPYTLTR